MEHRRIQSPLDLIQAGAYFLTLFVDLAPRTDGLGKQNDQGEYVQNGHDFATLGYKVMVAVTYRGGGAPVGQHHRRSQTLAIKRRRAGARTRQYDSIHQQCQKASPKFQPSIATNTIAKKTCMHQLSIIVGSIPWE